MAAIEAVKTKSSWIKPGRAHAIQRLVIGKLKRHFTNMGDKLNLSAWSAFK